MHNPIVSKPVNKCNEPDRIGKRYFIYFLPPLSSFVKNFTKICADGGKLASDYLLYFIGFAAFISYLRCPRWSINSPRITLLVAN
jgi:hypothetical protein